MSGRDVAIDHRLRPPQAHRARVTDPGRTVLVIPKVQKFLEALVAGNPIKDAAKASGIRVNRARRLPASCGRRSRRKPESFSSSTF